MVILDTDSKKDSFEAIIKEYFSAKPEDTHYSYYGWAVSKTTTTSLRATEPQI